MKKQYLDNSILIVNILNIIKKFKLLKNETYASSLLMGEKHTSIRIIILVFNFK